MRGRFIKFCGKCFPLREIQNWWEKKTEWDFIFFLKCYFSAEKYKLKGRIIRNEVFWRTNGKITILAKKSSLFWANMTSNVGYFRMKTFVKGTLGADLSQQSTPTCEAWLGHPWLCNTGFLSGCRCLCLHVAPVIRARCLILWSYLLLSIRAFMGRCCQSYHGNQCLWQCVASPAGLWMERLQVLLHSTF